MVLKIFEHMRFSFYSVHCLLLAFSLSSVADGIFTKMDIIVSPTTCFVQRGVWLAPWLACHQQNVVEVTLSDV